MPPETGDLSPELISAVGAVILGMVSAIVAYLQTRNGSALKRVRSLAKENKNLRDNFESALGYVYTLRQRIRVLGRRPPAWPKDLADYAHEDEPGQEGADEPAQ
jgi:hypothetical protein